MYAIRIFILFASISLIASKPRFSYHEATQHRATVKCTDCEFDYLSPSEDYQGNGCEDYNYDDECDDYNYIYDQPTLPINSKSRPSSGGIKKLAGRSFKGKTASSRKGGISSRSIGNNQHSKLLSRLAGKHGNSRSGFVGSFSHPLAGNVVNVLGVVNPSYRSLGSKTARAAYRAQLGLPV